VPGLLADGSGAQEALSFRPRLAAKLFLARADGVAESCGQLVIGKIVKAGWPDERQRDLVGPVATAVVGTEEFGRPMNYLGPSGPRFAYSGPFITTLHQAGFDRIAHRVDHLVEDVIWLRALNAAGWLACPECLEVTAECIHEAGNECVTVTLELDDAALWISSHIVFVVRHDTQCMKLDAVPFREDCDDVEDRRV